MPVTFVQGGGLWPGLRRLGTDSQFYFHLELDFQRCSSPGNCGAVHSGPKQGVSALWAKTGGRDKSLRVKRTGEVQGLQ